ncbi:hypothetical protein JCM19000A_38580 [Silvimonas sp. JCM 19000]
MGMEKNINFDGHPAAGGAYTQPSISFLVIARDEARCIGRMIESICPIANEIIIVDAGSIDDTLKIINSFSVAPIKLFNYPWAQSFSAARNYALAQATCEWAIFIDADEYLLEKDRRSLCHELARLNGSRFDAAEVRIADEMQGGTTSPRIFRTGCGIAYVGRVHEWPLLESGTPPQVAATSIVLQHDGYAAPVLLSKAKLARNLALSRLQLRDTPDEVRWRYFFARDLFYYARESGESFAEAQAIFNTLLQQWQSRHIDQADAEYIALSYSKLAELILLQGDLDRALQLLRQIPDDIAPQYCAGQRQTLEYISAREQYLSALSQIRAALDANKGDQDDASRRLYVRCLAETGDLTALQSALPTLRVEEASLLFADYRACSELLQQMEYRHEQI